MRTNIIEARFKGGTVTETLPVYQWDYGQILTFPDLSLPANYEVHFARGMRTIATILGNASGVQVPDALLQRSGALTVYVYLHAGENDGETVYTICVPVIARAPVSDEQPDPVEVDAISQAITALNQAKNGIEETVSSALQEAKDSGEFDGVSPTIAVTDIEGGHRITITDATGAHSFDVMNGEDGESSTGAVQSVNGQTGTVVLGAVDVGAGTYSKPAGGIPASDLAAGVIPEVPVQDVQVNGVSVLQDGVANVPIAAPATTGVVRVSPSYGLNVNTTGFVQVKTATIAECKNQVGSTGYQPLTVFNQHAAAFYGLAKAAGSDEKNSTLPVGQYTDNAKDKIQQMLGIIDMIAPHEGAQAANAYSVGGAFCYSGKLYKATASIDIGDAIVPGTNCTQTTLIELIGGI